MSFEEFATLIRRLDNISCGAVGPRFSSASSYFVVDENNHLVGAASLRHYLTIEGMNTRGHFSADCIHQSRKLKPYSYENNQPDLFIKQKGQP